MAEYSKEQIQEAMAALEREKKRGAKNKARRDDPAIKAKMKAAGEVKRAKDAILRKKALAAGITVTDKEAADYLSGKKKG